MTFLYEHFQIYHLRLSSADGADLAPPFEMSRGRRLADAMMTASSVGAVVAGMAIISNDARMLIANTIFSDSAELSAMAFRAQAFGHEFVRAAAAYRAENSPMVGFTIFAVVLTFLMFRT